MSAIIQELKVRNFEGYKSAELPFSAGLNLIRGRNSTGKSTILDAIGFALFGEAPDVNKKLLVSRLPNSQEVEVYIKFASPRTHETVEVTRKGKLDFKGAYKTEEKTLNVNGKEVNLESDEDLRGKITELMGASFRKFVNLVYVRQGKLTTILEPQKDQMDSVIGITLLRELREQLDEAREELEKYEGKDAATEARSLEEIMIPQLKSEIGELASDIQTLGKEVQELGELVKKAESPELAELLRRVEERDQLDTKIVEVQTKIQELLRNAGATSDNDLKLKIQEYDKKAKELKKTEDALAKKVQRLLGAWTTAKGKADSLQSEIEEHESLLKQNISKCPTCGQDIKPASMRKMVKADKARIEVLRREEERRQEEYETENAKLEDVKGKGLTAKHNRTALEGMKQDLDQYSETIAELKNTLMNTLLPPIRESLERLGLALKAEDPELEVKLAQQLPVQPEDLANKKKDLEEKQAKLGSKTRRQEELEGKLNTHETAVAKLKRRIEKASLARRLAEGFDQGVEARRKDYLKRIEYKALEFYKTMTDQHVYSAISMDPEDYTVSVHPRGLTEQIPATRVGGGHQTILALAVRLALLEILGFRSLLILDEPTYGVDSENLPQLASQLGEASRQLSQMILVTHHDICQEEASNIIEVTVREDGISKAEVKL
jgi:exonuclease SbcC